MPAIRAAAEEPQPLPMGMSFLMRIFSGTTSFFCRLEDFAIGGKDQMAFEFLADFAIAPGSRDRKDIGGARFECQVEIHGERGGIERGAQIGRRGGQFQAKRLL